MTTELKVGQTGTYSESFVRDHLGPICMQMVRQGRVSIWTWIENEDYDFVKVNECARNRGKQVQVNDYLRTKWLLEYRVSFSFPLNNSARNVRWIRLETHVENLSCEVHSVHCFMILWKSLAPQKSLLRKKSFFFLQRSFYFPFLRDGEADRDLLRCLAGEALLDLLLERLLDFLPPFLAGAGDRLAFDARLLGRLFDLLLERLLDLSFLSSALSSLSLRLLSGERDLDRLLDRDADFRSLDRRRGDRLRDRRRRGERLRDLKDKAREGGRRLKIESEPCYEGKSDDLQQHSSPRRHTGKHWRKTKEKADRKQ